MSAWALVTEVGRVLGEPADSVSRSLSRGAMRRIAEEAFGRRVAAIEAEGRQG